uniref:Uncharacterized protein n=1 Tax=Tetranychus urticae TaxID=32264 RepID=T1KNJ4_TETUR
MEISNYSIVCKFNKSPNRSSSPASENLVLITGKFLYTVVPLGRGGNLGELNSGKVGLGVVTTGSGLGLGVVEVDVVGASVLGGLNKPSTKLSMGSRRSSKNESSPEIIFDFELIYDFFMMGSEIEFDFLETIPSSFIKNCLDLAPFRVKNVSTNSSA